MMLPLYGGPSHDAYRYRNRKILLVFAIALGFLVRLLLIAIDSNDFTLLTFSVLGILVMIVLFWRRVEHPINRQLDEHNSSNDVDLQLRRDELSSILANSTYIYKSSTSPNHDIESYSGSGDEHGCVSIFKDTNQDVSLLLSQTACSICLDAYVNNEMLVVLPCHHLFHHDCILAWLLIRSECPICKADTQRSPASLADRAEEGNSAIVLL